MQLNSNTAHLFPHEREALVRACDDGSFPLTVAKGSIDVDDEGNIWLRCDDAPRTVFLLGETTPPSEPAIVGAKPKAKRKRKG